MLHSIRVRRSQGWQYIPDVRRADPKGFRGLPVIGEGPCAEGCAACVDACSTRAIVREGDRIAIDLGRCIFCAECVDVCPDRKIEFTNQYRTASATREALIVRPGQRAIDPVEASSAFKQLFGRSLKLRQVSAGGCNGCELELNASANVNFDVGRWGIDWVASPRHADGLVLSGPLTRHMIEPLRRAWAAVPAPKLIVAVGACGISGGPYHDAEAIDRRFLDEFTPQLFVPGCPPHPLTFVNGLLDLLGIA